MNDAQTWAAIVGLFTLQLGFMALMTRMFGTTLTARFEGVDAKIDALTVIVANGFEQVDKRFEQVDRRFEQVDKRFEQVDKRFDRLEHRVDALDRDVSAITRRLMDGPDVA
ncbi:MAG TPA: hypothetical protein VNZ66_01080 [Aeromicrobium sp.]|nr:hypothetical protein [Aeromicrobium sp.]